MHIRSKQMAYSGLMLAMTLVFMLLSGIIETNTLFLLAAASFFVGIIYREFSVKMAVAFYLASVILGLILVPNKFYVGSYTAMATYILIMECVLNYLAGKKEIQKLVLISWIAKYILFNLIFIPGIILFQKLLFTKPIQGVLWIAVIAVGQIGLLLYDKAYEYVQNYIWKKLIGRLAGKS